MLEDEEEERPHLTRSQETRIDRAIKALNQVMEEIQLEYPEANYYLEDSCHFNVMSGLTHDGPYCTPRQDRIMHSAYLQSSGGGAW